MRQTLLFLLCFALGCHTLQGGEKGGLVRLAESPGALEAAYAPRRIALLVGIPVPGDEFWRPLRFAEKDVTDLASALKDPSKGGFTLVRTLLRPEETTGKALLAAVESLRSLSLRPEDIVLLYVSAHGTLGRDGHGELARYLVTSEARYREVSKSALSVDALEAAFDSLPSRRRVLVLATCHSGSGKSLLPEEVSAELASLKGLPRLRPLEDSSRAAIVLSASDWGETAREDAELRNDIYTHFLVEGLDGSADRNGDGAVSATEAHDFARRKTYAFTQGRQRPSAKILEVGADPVFLSGTVRQPGAPELYSYSPRLDGFTLKVDGAERGELPGGAVVGVGRHELELTKGGEVLLHHSLEMQQGARVALDELLDGRHRTRALMLTAGALGFLDARSRNELLPFAPVGGVGFRQEGLFGPRLGLALELQSGLGRGELSLPGGLVPFGYKTVHLAASVPYLLLPGRFSVSAGPKMAVWWLSRSFELEAYRAVQSYWTATPGVAAAGRLGLTEELELSLEVQAMLSMVAVDGQSRALGFLGAFLSTGYRF